MTKNPSDPVTILAELEACDTETLRKRWTQYFRFAPPPRFRRDFLLRAVAYALQERTSGGLKPATTRRLKRIAADLRERHDVKPYRVAMPAKGSRFMREWNGRTEIVERVANGYAWHGNTYSSLTAVARAITGTAWSGPAFFGLKAKRAPKPACNTDLESTLGPASWP